MIKNSNNKPTFYSTKVEEDDELFNEYTEISIYHF